MVEQFESESADVVVAFEEVPVEEVVRYGIARPASDGEAGEVFDLADLIEKPSVEEAPSRLAVAARYVLSPRIFDALATTEPGKGGEIQLTDAIAQEIEQGRDVYGFRFRGQRFDCGSKSGFLQATVAFALARDDLRDDLSRYLRDVVQLENAAE